ncbi:NADH-quinone oxidoreductase subunit L [Helicobacter heilmannii]|uniref:NADH-ubiquinone oxidoreductase chain L n=1 Tax=Helicobacter heilmannii TaxID=35817 RepID=A0A0K2Y8Z7_HELHE|nr:NADH-quinone oxidoreductase subunit L [Helicobacter heilmannii]BDQ26709.1 NADH-quinone oxidoreductase subunit L [Helicobacter heilmannii]CCM11105.1 NADH-ubiquinone oxidoreductase chain L [Helicobacter heilmannii ASB1.4]CRI34617.1 NADH-ubiquinone oxidoreductase chain L [Helicobacter heilmannii]
MQDHICASLVLEAVLFLPLAGALYAGCFGTCPKSLQVGVINSSLLGLAFLCALYLLNVSLHHQMVQASLFDWMVLGGFSVGFSFALDPISAVMIVVVTLVSFLVHVYSIGYMQHDKGYNRYFSYLSGFVFSMLVLVLSDNFLGLFVGWEGVGLCSYLLIGFWYQKTSANNASIEAFVMNRIADLGMLMGILWVQWTFGSVKYSEVFSNLSSANPHTLYGIGLLLFIGAVGKSAQFPLHTWLANAMEGPTPVSALIHAATMVTAGVYLVIRAHPLYSALPGLGYGIACLGAFVALFGASMALVNKDLKRIVAYSTLSQLGYMFVGAGLGAYWIALFHLFTHAFFKALLFLGAGNVMHAMHDELDISKMGGLYKPLKTTAILMGLASLALCGLYPFAGFFSKDKILEVAFATGHHGLFLALLIGALFTAFYSFRLLMLVFFAPKVHAIDHPHEAPGFMLVAMLPLAILAVVAGFFEHGFFHFVSKAIKVPSFADYPVPKMLLLALTTIGVLLSIAYAVQKYKKGFGNKEGGFFYRLLLNQYYIPALYIAISRAFLGFAFWVWRKIEVRMLDAFVDTIAKIPTLIGQMLIPLQSGNLSGALRLMAFGVVVIVFVTMLSFWS